jgi:N6-L-threonylcarbamoyladenine synthase
MAFDLNLPLLGVHHLEGHILSTLSERELPFPHTSLVVSGGHTELIEVLALGEYRIVGQTLDDAAGEAFDKAARLLGLGYPGGRAIQDAARRGNPNKYSLPRGLRRDSTDFSFSGLKTAVSRLVETEGARLDMADAAASVQEAIVSVLVERATNVAESLVSRALSLVGGVAANLELRTRLARECDRRGIEFVTPAIELCTDNAAMIGLASIYRLERGERDDFELEALPNAEL